MQATPSFVGTRLQSPLSLAGHAAGYRAGALCKVAGAVCLPAEQGISLAQEVEGTWEEEGRK